MCACVCVCVCVGVCVCVCVCVCARTQARDTSSGRSLSSTLGTAKVPKVLVEGMLEALGTRCGSVGLLSCDSFVPGQREAPIHEELVSGIDISLHLSCSTYP
jgi:hypothetical protein